MRPFSYIAIAEEGENERKMNILGLEFQSQQAGKLTLHERPGERDWRIRERRNYDLMKLESDMNDLNL